ncbi:M48 family metallopeptidase [Thalassotalea fonticola]|uniref:M48 family metallopeptidase n=1 Tax=Thalassotalea fonticola TaxID=3065649 RepID=A0ABZ0GM56_9GAMM|nr:M48 family metallopeptidase [Colwelliaceae bacterium S1-1]
MKYTNPIIPEGINVKDENPLKEFFILLFGVGIVISLVIIVLSVIAGWLVKFIPFSAEYSLVQNMPAITSVEKHINQQTKDEQSSQLEVQVYLQQLANKLSIVQNLPSDMTITVHYVADDTVNAFATLGGNIIIHQGLLAKFDHENTLAMVMAHELAHIKYRHPIIAMGRGLTVAVALTTIAGVSDSSFVSNILGQISLLTVLAYNREQERQADEAAYNTVVKHYGHAQGALELFEALHSVDKLIDPPKFLSTHPLTAERIENLKRLEVHSSAAKTLTPLPDLIKLEKTTK